MSERAAVASFYDVLGSGAAALLFSGRAGQGKTAVWSYARTAGRARVLTARPGELATKLTYSGVSELFDGLDAEIASLPAEQARALRQATRLDAIAGTGTDHATVAVAVAGVLRTAATQPLVLAIDDLQWLDTSSARVLGFALRRLADRPVGVLASQRGDRMSHVLTTGFPRDRITTVELGPMSVEETDQLIRIRLGAALLRPLLGHIHHASGGNPLFSLELARTALRDPRPLAGGAPLPVSSNLRELMGRRIASLGTPTREVLLLVAAAGDTTEHLIEQVLGRPGVAAVARGIDAGLLVSERGHIRATHPLLASTAYDATEPGRRRRLHQLLASLSSDDEQRARHLSTATELPDAAAAAQVEAGAHLAHTRGAPDAAGALAQRALDLTPETDRADGFRRAISAADYLRDAGDMDRCLRILHRLAAQLPAGPDRAQVLRRLATATATGSSWAAARDLLGQGLAEAGADPMLRSVLHRDRAFVIMQSADVRACTADATVALRYAARATEDDVRADAETTFLLQAIIRGDVQASSQARLAHLAALPDTEDRWIPSGSRLVLVAAMLKWIDDFGAARALLSAVYTHRWDRQEDGLLIPALFQLAELECWSGHLAEARRLTALALDTEHRSPREGSRLMALYPAALAAARVGDSAQARPLAQQCLELGERTGDGRHQMRALSVLGSVALAEGDLDAARTHLARADRLQDELGYLHPGVIRCAADYIETLISLGDLSTAELKLRILHEQAARSCSAWGTMTALRCRGLLDAARGDLGLAVAALTAARAAAPAVPDPVEQGRTLLVLGIVLRRQRRRREAGEVLHQAQSTFAGASATGWADKAAAELQRLRGRGPVTSGLTPTETQIAGLVAAGRSNKEVAAEIYLSPKTVEAHLSSIYRKLGTRSRTELANHMHNETTEEKTRDITDGRATFAP